MKIESKVKRFQQGGAAPAPQEAPEGGAPAGGAPAEGGAPQEGGQNPMDQILQVAEQAVQTQNCEAALAVCQALVQVAGGGAAPAEAPQEEPTFARNGAKLIRVR
jgi:hypothetical protein